MNRMSVCLTLVLLLLLLGSLISPYVSAQPSVEKYLVDGRLADGEKALLTYLEEHPGDDDRRFGLGVIQFFQSVENLGQSLHRCGSQSDIGIPFLRLPVPENDKPQPITYDQFRDIFKTMVRDLDKASETLAEVRSDDVNLALHLFRIHLDWNENGIADGSESFIHIGQQYLGRNAGRQGDLRDVVVDFDRTDVYWLQGYCHLLRAMCETVLAYDQEAVWDVASRQLIHGAQVRYDFLMEEKVDGFNLFSRGLLDLVAGIHNMGMPLVDSSRLAKAHGHLLETIKQSRLMWESLQGETDNRGEWIPNSTQTTAVSTVRVTEEMIEGWIEILDEIEMVLKGDKLVPFWRGTDKRRGVNLYRVFHEPREFDLVLWIHGSAASPYLEKGEVSTPETWRRFQRIFQGDLLGFATWFN